MMNSTVATQAFVASLAMFTVTVSAGVPREPDRNREVQFRKLEFGKQLIRVGSEERMIDVEYSQLPRIVQSGTYNALLLRVRKEAAPYVKPDYRSTPESRVRVSASAGSDQDDLIEFSWVFLGQHLRMVASVNAIRIEIGLDEADGNEALDQFGEEQVDRVRGLVAAIFRLSGQNTYGELYQIDLPWPNTLEDGVTFCSDVERSIRTLMRWHQRIDVFVENGVLSILSYRKIPQMAMFRDGSKWFPDDFRARVHEAQRAGRMLDSDDVEEKP